MANKKYYKEHKKRIGIMGKRGRKRNSNFIKRVKQQGKCIKCGNSDYRVLIFHHLSSDNKSFEISYGKKTAISLDKIRREIEKCVLLCANCHAIVHYKE